MDNKNIGKAVEKLAMQMLPEIYPTITDIKVDGPKKKYVGLRVTDYGFDVDVYTTIPSGITKQNYWDSEYADNDFSYMIAYHFPKLLKYFGINSYLPTDVNVYNVDGKLIGKF